MARQASQLAEPWAAPASQLAAEPAELLASRVVEKWALASVEEPAQELASQLAAAQAEPLVSRAVDRQAFA
jgi:hypothetical protein